MHIQDIIWRFTHLNIKTLFLLLETDIKLTLFVFIYTVIAI